MKGNGFVMTFDKDGVFVLGTIKEMVDKNSAVIEDMFGCFNIKTLITDYKEIEKRSDEFAYVLKQGTSPRR